jgi:hypothetical protein
LACRPPFQLRGTHLAVDQFELLERQRDPGLDVDEFLLPGLNGRQMSLERRAKLPRSRRHVAGPFKVGLVTRERLDKRLAWHATTVDGNLQDAALDRTNLSNPFVHTGTQAIDSFGRKADRRQFALDLRAHLRNGCGTGFATNGYIRQLLEQCTHARENRKTVVREFFEAGCVRFLQILGVGFNVVAVRVIVGGLCFHIVFFGLQRHFAFVHVVADAIDQFANTHLAGNDAVHIGKNCGHDRRTRGDRLNHVLQAVFDTLCDLDFASAGQQFAGTHFTHVHPDRISRAAEFGIDGRQCSFRVLVRLIIECHGSRGVV